MSYWLRAQDANDTVIGVCHSFYYFGVALGSFAIPWLTRRLGTGWCASLGMLASGLTLAAFPAGNAPLGWCALRFLNGWAGAMSLVPLETLVSRESTPSKKTQNFACYGVSLTLGGALGIEFAPALLDLANAAAFALGGLAPALAAIGVLIGLRRHPRDRDVVEQTPLALGRNFLSYGTAWGQGFLEGGMLAFLALFLQSRGFSGNEASTLMSVTIIGVILFQVPVSWLADRHGKTPILLGCYALAIAGMLAIPWLTNGIVLAATLFTFGACSGAMYPLGLSLLSDRMPDHCLARAYAWYLAIECIGSQIGAAVMGQARDSWGEVAMFPAGIAALGAVLATWGALRFRGEPGKLNHGEHREHGEGGKKVNRAIPASSAVLHP